MMNTQKYGNQANQAYHINKIKGHLFGEQSSEHGHNMKRVPSVPVRHLNCDERNIDGFGTDLALGASIDGSVNTFMHQPLLQQSKSYFTGNYANYPVEIKHRGTTPVIGV